MPAGAILIAKFGLGNCPLLRIGLSGRFPTGLAIPETLLVKGDEAGTCTIVVGVQGGLEVGWEDWLIIWVG